MRDFEGSNDSGLFANPLAKAVVGVVAVLVLSIGAFNLWENLDASDIMVIQAPGSGNLTWSTTPGIKFQGLGKVTTYKKRHQFEFECPRNEDGTVDPARNRSLPTTFNDGGRAFICGSIAWEMPLSVEDLNPLHAKYGSDNAIQEQIIRTAVEKSVTMTGPLISSTESYSARRNDLLSLVLDQVKHGVYRTNVREERAKDEMTGQDKTIKVVNLIPSTRPEDHGYARQEPSPLDEFKLTAFNLAIVDVAYDPAVIAQIKRQQDATMEVQGAIADAKKAEQAAITAAKNGEAEAATAKWKQEVIRAQQVTEAQQKRDVAALDVQTAELRKREAILQGEGEAAKRRLIMNADGALAQKLEAWVTTNKNYADAIKGYTGQWVPSVVMGGQDGRSGVTGAADLISLLTAKTARDIGLDLRTQVVAKPEP